jgi:hypothetical protein
MTPKEKAQELIDKYDSILTYKSKQCALVAVDELINQEEKYNNGSFYSSKYWKEVKQHIEKI